MRNAAPSFLSISERAERAARVLCSPRVRTSEVPSLEYSLSRGSALSRLEQATLKLCVMSVPASSAVLPKPLEVLLKDYRNEQTKRDESKPLRCSECTRANDAVCCAFAQKLVRAPSGFFSGT